LREGTVIDGDLRDADGDEFRKTQVVMGGGRRRWSALQKAAIVTESLADGTRVSEVAARHGVSESLVFTWRRQAKASKTASGSPTTEGQPSTGPTFVPVRITEEFVEEREQTEPSRPSAVIEITLSDASIRVTAGADAATLAMVLAAVRAGR
jgi:transposase